MSAPNAEHAEAVIRVGDGRGFIIETGVELWRRDQLVVTAAHCLPHFPPCHGGSYIEERTYPNLLGPIGAEPGVWAECLFADPIADLAVLGCPDDQALFDQADAYESFTEARPSLRISEVVRPESEAFLLSLDRRWTASRVRPTGPALWLTDAVEGIRGGMSGSPIVLANGTAVGVVCVSGGGLDLDAHTEGGPNPRLTHALPGWLLCA